MRVISACIWAFLTVPLGVLGSLKSYLFFMSLWMAWKTGIASVYNLVYSGLYRMYGAVCFFSQACFMNRLGFMNWLGLFL